MKERYSYVILVLISVLLSGGAVIFGIVHDAANQRKFCDVVSSIATKPIQKPADPKKDPSRERSYTIYMKFVHLDHSLGCNK